MMKSSQSGWGIFGLLVGEILTFIDLGIELYTGKLTWIELVQLLLLCLTLAVVMIFLIKKRNKK